MLSDLTHTAEYMEDISWPHGDLKILFEKKNFASSRSHVMFYLLYNTNEITSHLAFAAKDASY